MADWTGEGVPSRRRFTEMAEHGYAGSSPVYRALALAVAADAGLSARLDALPPAARQPNLVFGAARYLDGPVADPVAFLDWCTVHWSELAEVITSHRTQTNEARRCTALLPVFAALPGPLALLEVGASAGLCLQPDRYAYRYRHVDRDGAQTGVGRSALTLDCEVTGDPPLPDAVPEVVWRAGLDLHPLDVRSDDDVRWLECLVWPEHTDRRAILRGAVEIARTDPPPVRAGDLLTALPALAADAPADATLVVFHSAVLAYLGPAPRAEFREVLTGLGRPHVWVANEAPGIVVDVDGGGHRESFVLARDGVQVAWAGQHGRSLDWPATPLPGQA